MATKFLPSIRLDRIRVTRLDSCGAKVVGACSQVVSDGITTVEATPNREAGSTYLVKKSNGQVAINDKRPDTIKWWDVVINFWQVDPDLLDIIGGAAPLLDALGTDTIGAEFGSGENAEAFTIEGWTDVAGDCAATEWGYVVIPYVRNGVPDGAINFGDSALSLRLRGDGFGAPATYSTGHHGDNPLLDTDGLAEGSGFGIVRTTVAPPALTTGCAAVS